jgi:hypothetical protein
MTKESAHIDTKTYRQVTADILEEQNTMALASDGLSMFPILKPHDILIIEKTSPESISRGDIIVFALPKKTIGHRVIAITKNESV